MKPPQNALVTLRALTAGILLGAVEPGLAQATQMLYSTPTNAARDTYTGGIGCKFQVGASNVIVSHLGFFDQNNDGLAVSHQAGLFDAGGSTLLGQVTVPAGTDAYLTNGFRWMPLDPPLLLASNTTYIVAAMVGNGDGDAWQDAFTPAWNPFFVGNTGTSTRHAMYGPGNAAWPPASFSQNGNNNTYGNVTLGYLEVGPARVGVAQTNVSISAGQTLSVLGFASGQQPVTYQWYLSPHTPLPNQTNASLIIADAATGDSGTYFLTASNALGSEQSADVTVLVTSFPVGITQEPTNLTVFANYPAAFSLVASGSPPVFFQWLRDGTVLPVATNASYSFTADLTNNGDIYSCLASNYTSLTPYIATSSDATLTVLPNLALPQQFLHGARANTATNNFSGLVGGQFAVGNSPVLVTHLGYYASQ
ncbi:MAG: immunoglobulin domain-containing protein, partial [Verrucomicrobia bacterium]|nr:immunoglobulin domain-containing protein [Verrucomicrobiota bacterium]